MTHSFLITGGTKKGRENVAARHASPERGDDGSCPAERGLSSPTNSTKFDTTILEPEEDKQTISIDQIRDLQHQLSLKPYAADHKIGILPEAQRMTTEAQNALLKTLEEPPAHSVLILTAPSAKQLLPTIVSRCQVVRLEAEVDLDFESEEHQKSAEDFLQLLQQGRGGRLAWAENRKSLIVNRESAVEQLDIWISVLRDLLLIQQGCQNLTLNSLPNSSNTSALHSAEVSSQSLTKAFEGVIETKNLVAKTNVSPRLALEVLLLDLPVLTNPKDGKIPSS